MNWLISDWRVILHSPFVEIFLALIALICGAIVGGEREKREKPAGLRTLMLVCLGAEAFTKVSFCFAGDSGDSGRVAAQIVTGIGFLGAGVILHGRGGVSGTTTAATIWVTAAIGMIAGAGYGTGAVGLSLLVRLVLTVISAYELHIIGGRKQMTTILDFNPDEGRARVRLERILVDYRISEVDVEWKDVGDSRHQLILRVHLPRHHLCELLADLVEIPDVLKVQENRSD